MEEGLTELPPIASSGSVVRCQVLFSYVSACMDRLDWLAVQVRIRSDTVGEGSEVAARWRRG